MSASGLEERIGTLLAQHRPELEQLVDQALERELNQLVEQRLAARNGEPAAKPATPAPIPHQQVGNAAATRVCAGCGRDLELARFEKGRAKCRECRRRENREREQRRGAERSPAEPEPEPEPVDAWLVDRGFAARAPSGELVATEVGLQAGAAIADAIDT